MFLPTLPVPLKTFPVFRRPYFPILPVPLKTFPVFLTANIPTSPVPFKTFPVFFKANLPVFSVPFTTLPNTPSSPTISYISGSNATVIFTSVSGANSYAIYYN